MCWIEAPPDPSSASHEQKKVDCHPGGPPAASEMTWRLPPTDDEEGASWLEGSQKDTRRKGRLSETAGLDRAFIQQHLLHHCCLCRNPLNRLMDSRDALRKTSLFFMIRSIRAFRQQQAYVTTFTLKSMKLFEDCTSGINGVTWYWWGQQGLKGFKRTDPKNWPHSASCSVLLQSFKQ